MGSIANKLEYLNTTKENIKDVINITNANITSDTPFANYSTKLYNGYINILKDSSLLMNNLPKETSTGVITNGVFIYEGKMIKLSTQSSTPTPSSKQEVSVVKTNVQLTFSNGTSSRNITISLGNNEICGIGNYKDELIIDKDGRCYLNKKIGKATLTGSESDWSASTIVKGTTTIGYRYQIRKAFAGVAVNNDGSVETPSLCDYFVPMSNQPFIDGTYTDIQDCMDKYGNSFIIYKYNSSNNRVIVFHNDYATTSNLTGFKNWLSSHNTTIYYALETPQLIDLNTTVDLTLYEGTNTITNNKNMEMEIKYIKSYED